MSSRVSNIIKAANIGVSTGRSVSTGGTQAGAKIQHQSQDSATINLHKNGEIIEAIEITCSCGQTTFIECVYQDQESAS